MGSYAFAPHGQTHSRETWNTKMGRHEWQIYHPKNAPTALQPPPTVGTDSPLQYRAPLEGAVACCCWRGARRARIVPSAAVLVARIGVAEVVDVPPAMAPRVTLSSTVITSSLSLSLLATFSCCVDGGRSASCTPALIPVYCGGGCSISLSTGPYLSAQCSVPRGLRESSQVTQSVVCFHGRFCEEKKVSYIHAGLVTLRHDS